MLRVLPLLIWVVVASIASDLVCEKELSAQEKKVVEIKVRRNIVYAEEKDSAKRMTSLDLYGPVSASGRPIMIWVHGGAWRIGDKRRVLNKPKAFVERGYLLVSVNYRLYPAADYKQQTSDIAKAIRWVRDNAKEIGGDPGKIYLMGHSAGAHLAALVATDESYLQKEKLPLSVIKGVVLLDGAGYDVPRQIELAGLSSLKQLYQTIFSEDEAKQKEASPINYVKRGKGIPPFLILHVARRADSKAQSREFGKKLKNAGISAEVVSAKNKSHATINKEFGLPNDAPTIAVFEFLESLEKDLK